MIRSLRSLLVTAVMAVIAPTTGTLLFLSALTPVAQAEPVVVRSTHSLRSASDRYREAALDFERHVHRDGHFDHYDKRLADRLADVSGEFRSAARKPRDVERLLYHWNDLLTTHARVEETLIRGCERHDSELIHFWSPVLNAFTCLVEEMSCFTDDHCRPYGNRHSPVETYPVVPSHDGHHQSGGVFGHNVQPFMNNVQPSANDVQPGFDPDYALPLYDRSQPPLGDARLNHYRTESPRVAPSRPTVQLRPSTPPFAGSRGAQIDTRRELGAAIATTLLNQLLN